jgi:hypothetical protein
MNTDRMMNRFFAGFVALLLVVAAGRASALSLGPDEFASARQLTCVLAQDSLGYLSDEEYEQEVGRILDDYSDEAADVVYAKALGYFDGLMFGIPETDRAEIRDRLLSFNASQACTANVSFGRRL